MHFREQLLLLISTPLYIFIIGLEIVLSNLRKQETYTVKDTFQNVYMMLLNGGIDLIFRAVYVGVLVWCYTHRIVEIHQVVAYWLILVLFEDFMYYWLHRMDHTLRFLWAVHVTHHSSQKYNFTTGFRSSVFEPLYRFIFFLPLAFCGFKPLDIVFIYSATQIWGIMVHTEKVGKLGLLEYILVTPSHHKVHHASNPKYLDKNMGMLLIFWDKLFGTFQQELSVEEYQPIRFGLTSPLEKQSPLYLVFHEWVSIWKDATQKDISLKARMGYLFGAPGWSHDGSRHTSEDMRKEEDRLQSKK
ncbi:sterol desaturase family protein [Pinibacter soli]|uniref:Sterol desaturase family protein n=1 Tax=Pinibacter soli TaxID=3044211 RepID=A0ABT6RGN2_9BACT|nr:sterol desaturase family protein [Pinibacter soli]MDI3321731.1 sterol desaturase family protein [Pinibacter soli]